MDTDDPFALPTEAAVTDSPLRNGRYMLPWRDGSKKSRGFMRTSNLVSAYSDQFALRLWEIGEVLQGVAMDPALYATVLAAKLPDMDKAERRKWTEAFIEHAKEASGGNAGSKHGVQRHAAVEAYHAGLPDAHQDAGTRRSLSLYAAALKRHRLRALPGMQERIILVEALEVCGQLDNILGQVCTNHVAGEPCSECFNNGWTNPMIADLKTQPKAWTYLEIAAQFAVYAHGDAMWDAGLGQWVDMPPVSQEIALMLWMPRETPDGEPRVDVVEVDIVAGWKTAQRAYEIVQDRAAGKAARNPRAWLRPAPPVTDVERWAARFAAVDTFAEGRTLVAECKSAGVWCEALAQSAKAAHDRLAVPA